jgi:Rad3-related DNA helicase
VLSCAAGTAVANSMTKQSALETSSCSSFTGGDLDDEALEEARAEGDALVTVGGGREWDGVLLSSWIV